MCTFLDIVYCYHLLFINFCSYISLEYQVYLNFYVIYRFNMICKWTLDIFGNLIAHWLLASQSASPLMPGLAWGVALFERESLDWRVNDSVHVTPSQGNPRWNKPLKRRRRFPFIYPHKTLFNRWWRMPYCGPFGSTDRAWYRPQKPSEM